MPAETADAPQHPPADQPCPEYEQTFEEVEKKLEELLTPPRS
jgi:hypothetical protein